MWRWRAVKNMDLRKVQDVDVKNKRVLLRVDFNVAVADGKAKEKFKIESCRETAQYLMEKNAKVALISHLGRPASTRSHRGELDGKINPEFSLEQIADDVEEILGVKVKFIDNCVGEKVKVGLDNLQSGEVLLLENVRFHEGEEENDAEFAKKMAENFEIFINDAFSVCHRDQASVTGVAKILPSFAGFRLQKEIENLNKVKNNPEYPAVAVIGGAKIETKLPLINNFEKNYEHILVGGKVACEAIDRRIEFSKKVILACDFEKDKMDIGTETIKKFSEIIKNARTVIWNGPMGKFEEEEFAAGTNGILKAIIESGAYSLVGGGESVQALEEKNLLNKISFVSTGGGAMLEYLSGGPMPGIEVLKFVGVGSLQE